jgi:hypothetical protein
MKQFFNTQDTYAIRADAADASRLYCAALLP